jgi:flagellar biosynthesis protein FlhF
MTNRWSLFASSVEAAVAEALRNNGPDTLLVLSRRASPAQAHLGQYEVIFELPPEEHEDPSLVETAPAAAAPLGPAPAVSLASTERQILASLLAEVRQTRQALAQAASASERPAGIGTLATIRELSARGFSEETAALLAAPSQTNVDGARGADVGSPARPAVEAELERRLRVSPTVGIEGASRSVVALVGPPGSGKTTTLVKLAVRFGLMERRPTLLVGADPNRIAACTQLQSYAAALGVTYAQADSATALRPLLEEYRNKEIVFVDVPGIGPREPELAREWTSVLAEPDYDVHLVLPATTRFDEMLRAFRRFQPMNPRRLLFTHLDEIAHGGGLLSLALQTQTPVSFLCHGQGVPEDIEPASNCLLSRLAWGEPSTAAAAA